MKNQFDKADGLLGYSFISMSACLLLQLLSTCGLCCNRDRCLRKEKTHKPDEPDFSDIRGDTTANNNSNNHLQPSELELPDPSEITKFRIKKRNYEIFN